MNPKGGFTTLTVSIPEGLKIEAKVKSLREGTTLSEAVEILFKAWIMGEVNFSQLKEALATTTTLIPLEQEEYESLG